MSAEDYCREWGDACMHRAAQQADWPALRVLLQELGPSPIMKCLVVEPYLPGWQPPQTVLLNIMKLCGSKRPKIETLRGIECVLPYTQADWWTRRTDYFKSALELLIMFGNVPAVQAVINAHPCLVDQSSGPERESPLHFAFDLCWSGHDFDNHFCIVAILIENNADPYHIDATGRSIVTSLADNPVWNDGGVNRRWTHERRQQLLDILHVDIPV